MSKARIAEKKLLTAIFHRGAPEIRKQLFIHYWPKFLAELAEENIMPAKKIKSCYQQSFARFSALTGGGRFSSISEGTLLQDLLLLAKVIGQEENGKDIPVDPPVHPFADSEIIVRFIKSKKDWIDGLVQKYFQHSFSIINLTSRKFTINEERLDQVGSAYPEAFMKLREKLEANAFVQPFTATLFTYFYRIFQFCAKKYLSHENKPEEQELPDADRLIDTQSNETGPEYWSWLADKISSDRLFDFDNEADFVRFLLNSVSENCRQLLLRHHAEGQDLESIGIDLGIPHPKMAISRCRQQLKNLFNSEDDV